jgi:HD-GYP domain-containing protein (c-di-GMP phosphodiesterase class II)
MAAHPRLRLNISAPAVEIEAVDKELAIAQALKYAEELRTLHASERRQRRAAEEALEGLEDSYRTTVYALAAALELRDDDTGGHAERVTKLGLELTRRVAPELADDPKLEYGFLLHDIGKIGIRDAVLLKPGALAPDELEEMRVHTRLGERVVAQIPYLDGVALEVVAAHHERWDGYGYPQGLKGSDIPLAARIFAIVDAFDAMTNDRPYRKAKPVEAALTEVERGAGRQFDPELVGQFLTLVRELRSAA